MTRWREDPVQADQEQLPQNEELVVDLICSQGDNPGSHMSLREIEKHGYEPQLCKTNGQEKRIEVIQTFEDTHDEFGYEREKNRKSWRIGWKVWFLVSRIAENGVWQDEKDFTLDVPLNSQNNRVYGVHSKLNIQDNRLFHHTNWQSKKVMVSRLCDMEWCYKAVFCER